LSGRSAIFRWGGDTLELLPGKAAWDPARRTLLLADLHLGKAETFQAHGIALPSDGDAGTLNALLELAAVHHPEQVVVLGDLSTAPWASRPSCAPSSPLCRSCWAVP
jgi:metallophosphoesterase superfamily enzyme